MLCSIRFIQCGLSQLLLHFQKKLKKMKNIFFIRLWLAYLSCFHPFCVSWEKNKNEKPCQFLHLVSSESSQWIVVHWLGLRLFGAMVWKLLIIEPFSQWKLELKWNWKMNWNLGVFLVFCKALGESGLIEFLSQFSELRREIYWFLNGFCCWKL
jgi:hypothetical protein